MPLPNCSAWTRAATRIVTDETSNRRDNRRRASTRVRPAKQVRLIAAELAGQRTIFHHRVEHPRQGRVEAQSRFAQRGQEFQGDGQVLLYSAPPAAAASGERASTARAPGSTTPSRRQVHDRQNEDRRGRREGERWSNKSPVRPELQNGQCRGKPDAHRQEHRGDEHGGGNRLTIARQEEPTAEESFQGGIAVGPFGQVGRLLNTRSRLRRFVPRRLSRIQARQIDTAGSEEKQYPRVYSSSLLKISCG